MIFGGEDHEQYLGCMNCSEYVHDSVENIFGPFGSKFSATSIRNHFSSFGSQFSSYSACNTFASEPPRIVDDDGNFYGTLTINRFNLQRIRNQTVLAWLEGICAN
jgi:hypothetical protein